MRRARKDGSVRNKNDEVAKLLWKLLVISLSLRNMNILMNQTIVAVDINPDIDLKYNQFL